MAGPMADPYSAIYTRNVWGAGPHRAGAIRLPVSRLYLHHTVTPFWVGVQAARNLQAIARSRGFVDISYSWLTDRQGNEIEGRGWGRQGAHTVGYNSTSHAISLVGNLESNPVPNGMVLGIVRLIRRHRPYGPGRITHPHSAVSQTACPGRHAEPRIPEFNSLAAGAPTPPPPPTPTTPLERLRMAVSDERFDEMYEWVRQDRLGRDEKETVRPQLDRIEEALAAIHELARQDRLGRDEKEITRPHLNKIEAKIDQLLAKET